MKCTVEFAEFNGVGCIHLPAVYANGKCGNVKPARSGIGKVLNKYNMSRSRIDRLISGFPVLRNKSKKLLLLQQRQTQTNARTQNNDKYQHLMAYAVLLNIKGLGSYVAARALKLYVFHLPLSLSNTFKISVEKYARSFT
jgi:endonuclease III-like uncharacterized protein